MGLIMPYSESNTSAHLLLFAQNAPTHWQDHIPKHGIYQSSFKPEWRKDRCCQDVPTHLLTDSYEIVPCLSLGSTSSWGYQCSLEYETNRGKRGISQLTPIGRFDYNKENSDQNKFVETKIDLWTIKTKLKWARVHWQIQGLTNIESISALFSLSFRRKTTEKSLTTPKLSLEKTVPKISQMSLRSDIKDRVCSPTCLSMLIQYHGITNQVYDVIAEAYHAPTQLYGVWPNNIRAANHYGLCGYICHIPNWETAENLLENSHPFIASIQYKRGQIADVPIEKTNGHLVIVRGCKSGKILVNDPAARTTDEVARSYNVEEFRKAWFGGSAIAYILFPI